MARRADSWLGHLGSNGMFFDADDLHSHALTLSIEGDGLTFFAVQSRLPHGCLGGDTASDRIGFLRVNDLDAEIIFIRGFGGVEGPQADTIVIMNFGHKHR